MSRSISKGPFVDEKLMKKVVAMQKQRERKPIKSVALTTNTSILTAIGNDYGYEYTFERQLEAFGGPSDVLIAISTSARFIRLMPTIW